MKEYRFEEHDYRRPGRPSPSQYRELATQVIKSRLARTRMFQGMELERKGHYFSIYAENSDNVQLCVDGFPCFHLCGNDWSVIRDEISE